MVTRFLLGAAFLGLASAQPALAFPAVTFSNTDGFSTAGSDSTLGWAFRAKANVTVSALGFFDSGQNGLNAASYQVGLWNYDTGVLLATTTVSSADPLTNQFRYHPITPLTLQTGQAYTVGAYYPANSPDTYLFNASNFAIDPQLEDFGYRFINRTGLTQPTLIAGSAHAYFGPNLFLAAPAPEMDPRGAAIPLGISVFSLLVLEQRRKQSRAV